MKEQEQIIQIIKNYSEYRKERISLIATENVSSRLCRSSYLLGLSDQYCSRLPENGKVVDNLSFGYIDELDNINAITREKIKEIFKVEECEARLLSGVNGLTVLLFGLLERDDFLFKVSDKCGGHLSVGPIAKKLGVNVVEIGYNSEYSFDMEEFKEKYGKYKPKVVFLDSSYILFPYPVRKIREIVGKDTIIVYDASHVISLIANGQFQNPLLEGADIIHATTHKILWGPQKSILLFKNKDILSEDILRIVKDVLVSNTHLHHIFALYLSLVEFEYFGKDYTCQLIKNNQSFAKCLAKKGFDIVGEKKGYTMSNQLWVRFATKEETVSAFEILERLKISTNVIFLPFNEWGLRIGTNELTRYGVKEEFFEKLATLFSMAIIQQKSVDECLEYRKQVTLEIDNLNVKYSFDDSKQGKEIIELLYKYER